MTILRIYDPPECDERGVPLDWERWPHDLHPEKLAVLCLRCWAAR